MKMNWIKELQSTEWKGNGELWLDPGGNQADHYECSLLIQSDKIQYSWTRDGETKKGEYIFSKGGATWTDSWHQPDSVPCDAVADAWGFFTVFHSYKVPSNPNWGWRSKLSQRPSGELVLQMTNITPWGEEGRAVRMIFTQVKHNP